MIIREHLSALRHSAHLRVVDPGQVVAHPLVVAPGRHPRVAAQLVVCMRTHEQML